ncbi:MAG: DICT sensory domain-containing protein [Haloferacaceae archaeon]
MSLPELIAGVEAHEKTLTVVNPDEGVTDALRAHFGDRNLVVESATTAAGPRNYMVLGDGEEYVTAAGVDDLLDPDSTDPEFSNRGYRSILDALDETMFTSYDRRRMLAASREIEDRAWRVGAGELHAGFQTVANLERQRDVYERLAGRTDLDVHAYAGAGERPSPLADVSLHLERTDEVRDLWFVVFDGDGVDEMKCALVAEEREAGFYGFWTYDPSTVDYALHHLRVTYAPEGADDGRTASGT